MAEFIATMLAAIFRKFNPMIAVAVLGSLFEGIVTHIDDIVSALDPNFGQTIRPCLVCEVGRTVDADY